MPARKKPKEQVIDSPKDWVAKHIREYIETDGEKGHKWQGKNTLLLTTRGRKTGKLRRTALIYGRDGENYLVVASNGGAAKNPNWYLNLLEEPKVTVQVGAETFKAKARPASPGEKPRLWKLMIAVWSYYAKFQAKTRREIPVVVIERV